MISESSGTKICGLLSIPASSTATVVRRTKRANRPMVKATDMMKFSSWTRSDFLWRPPSTATICPQRINSVSMPLIRPSKTFSLCTGFSTKLEDMGCWLGLRERAKRQLLFWVPILLASKLSIFKKQSTMDSTLSKRISKKCFAKLDSQIKPRACWFKIAWSENKKCWILSAI